MSDGKFGEPWRLGEGNLVVSCDEGKIVRGYSIWNGPCSPIYRCNDIRRRIVTCVNVFKGVKDPEAELTRLRGIEEAVRRLAADVPEDMNDLHDLESLVGAVDEFLAETRTALGDAKGGDDER